MNLKNKSGFTVDHLMVWDNFPGQQKAEIYIRQKGAIQNDTFELNLKKEGIEAN